MKIQELPEQEKEEMRNRLLNWVKNEHDLQNLTKKIVGEFR